MFIVKRVQVTGENWTVRFRQNQFRQGCVLSRSGEKLYTKLSESANLCLQKKS